MINLPTTVFENLQAGKKQTVIAYGTSLTHQDAWTGDIGRFFTTKFPDQVTFKNAAQSGKSSKWALANFEKRVLAHRGYSAWGGSRITTMNTADPYSMRCTMGEEKDRAAAAACSGSVV